MSSTVKGFFQALSGHQTKQTKTGQHRTELTSRKGNSESADEALTPKDVQLIADETTEAVLQQPVALAGAAGSKEAEEATLKDRQDNTKPSDDAAATEAVGSKKAGAGSDQTGTEKKEKKEKNREKGKQGKEKKKEKPAAKVADSGTIIASAKESVTQVAEEIDMFAAGATEPVGTELVVAEEGDQRAAAATAAEARSVPFDDTWTTQMALVVKPDSSTQLLPIPKAKAYVMMQQRRVQRDIVPAEATGQILNKILGEYTTHAGDLVKFNKFLDDQILFDRVVTTEKYENLYRVLYELLREEKEDSIPDPWLAKLYDNTDGQHAVMLQLLWILRGMMPLLLSDVEKQFAGEMTGSDSHEGLRIRGIIHDAKNAMSKFFKENKNVRLQHPDESILDDIVDAIVAQIDLASSGHSFQWQHYMSVLLQHVAELLGTYSVMSGIGLTSANKLSWTLNGDVSRNVPDGALHMLAGYNKEERDAFANMMQRCAKDPETLRSYDSRFLRTSEEFFNQRGFKKGTNLAVFVETWLQNVEEQFETAYKTATTSQRIVLIFSLMFERFYVLIMALNVKTMKTTTTLSVLYATWKSTTKNAKNMVVRSAMNTPDMELFLIKCYTLPEGVVHLFFKGNATPHENDFPLQRAIAKAISTFFGGIKDGGSFVFDEKLYGLLIKFFNGKVELQTFPDDKDKEACFVERTAADQRTAADGRGEDM